MPQTTRRLLARLEDGVDRGDFSTVGEVLDAGFYRFLFDAPDALESAFTGAPDAWLAEHPRHANSRAILTVVHSSGRILDPTANERFVAWVQGQDKPAIRDELGVLTSQLREQTARGWFQEASASVEPIFDLMHTVGRADEGMLDVASVVLRSCGEAKLLAGELNEAMHCFQEAVRWSTEPREHPIARYCRGYLALVHALEERYADAEALLGGSDDMVRTVPGTVRFLYEPPELLTRILIAIAALDIDRARRLMEQVDDSILIGHLGWVVKLAAARLALYGGDVWTAVHDLDAFIAQHGARTAPASFAGAVLRCCLASLYQSAGDLQAAGRVLGMPGLPADSSWVIATAVRQQLLRGSPTGALALLRDRVTEAEAAAPIQCTATGAVLYATAEFEASGEVSTPVLQQTVSMVRHRNATSALVNASAGLRHRLQPLVGDTDWVDIAPWSYRERVRLTPRECEVLAALRQHLTIPAVAAALYVSSNTAKTHVRALYRKLGAHTRDEALWLGSDW